MSASTTGKLRYEHYVCFPDDGNRHEIIDGDHYMNPAPTPRHQAVSMRLSHQLYSQIELRGLGRVFAAPTDIHMTEFDIVQPDLVVILKAHEGIITPAKVKGSPDLIVEIIAPLTEENDRTLKKELFRKCGVPEYWLVDPLDHSFEQLVLQDDDYQKHTVAHRVQAGIVESLAFDLSEIW